MGLKALSFAQALAHRASSTPHEELMQVVGEDPWAAAELWEAAGACAYQLNDLGPRGATFATATDTSPHGVIVTAAISANGGVELALNLELGQSTLVELTALAKAVAIITTTAMWEAHPILTELSQRLNIPVVVVGTDLSLRPRQPAPNPLARASTEPALIVMTSGTTGEPKAALLPVGAGFRQAALVSKAMRYGRRDVVYSVFGWHHINARHAGFLAAVLGQARFVADRQFSATTFWERVAAHDITAFNFMGAVCALLLAQPSSPADTAHRVVKAYGGPAPAEMVEAFADRFGVQLLQAYACTELGDVAITTMGDVLPGAAGRIQKDYEVKLVDPAGQVVSDGQTGHILVRPRKAGTSLIGYIGDPRSTVAAWENEWFQTRDLGCRKGDWLWFKGRLSDVIRRRGINIPPTLIEEVLRSHPSVAAATAVAVPSPLTEDEVLAYIVPTSEKSFCAQTVYEFCQAQLPEHAVPHLFCVRKQLPYNANLKLDRHRLRQQGIPTDVINLGRPLPSALESS